MNETNKSLKELLADKLGISTERLDIAPEIKQEPVAFMIDDVHFVHIERTARNAEALYGWTPLFAFHPDARAEIAKLDARIKELEKERAEYMGYSHVDNYIKKQATRIAELECRLSGLSDLTGLMQSSLEGDTQRIGELLDERNKQAAEISRLQKEVVNRNARALEGDKAVAVRETLVDQIEAQEKEISRLKVLVGKCEEVIERYTASEQDTMNGSFRVCCYSSPNEPHSKCNAQEVLNAIKEEGL